jgi:transposase
MSPSHRLPEGAAQTALTVQEGLGRDPHTSDLYVFRGRCGDLIKCLWHDGLGLSLYAKRRKRCLELPFSMCW